jgi:DNA-binding SARP family transcriptional activator
MTLAERRSELQRRTRPPRRRPDDTKGVESAFEGPLPLARAPLEGMTMSLMGDTEVRLSPSSTGRVYLDLLGIPTIRRPGLAPMAVPPSLQSLLALLALDYPHGCHRDVIIDRLWPDLSVEHGHHRLNTNVWRARHLFADADRRLLKSSRAGLIALDCDAVIIDITPLSLALDERTRRDAVNGDIEALSSLEHAAFADVGRFLTGNYDDWVVQTRCRLELAALRSLETLVEAAATPEAAIEWATRLLTRDPLREDAHRRLIRLLAETGRRSDALRQYDLCVQILNDELGVEPLMETTLAAAAARDGAPLLPVNPKDPKRALSELRLALSSCRASLDLIEVALTSLA